MPTTTAQPGTSADVCTPKAVIHTQLVASKALQLCAYWLVRLNEQTVQRQTLDLMHLRYVRRKRPNVYEADAIWAGVCALNQDINARVERIQRLGGLLFVGSSPALVLALRVEGIAA